MKQLGAEERKHLREMLGENICFDEPMSRHTSFRAGGPAAAYASPDSREKLITLVRWCAERNFLYSIIGDGTNLLVKDSGYPGILIVLTKCLGSTEIIREDDDTFHTIVGLHDIFITCYKNREMLFQEGLPGNK